MGCWHRTSGVNATGSLFIFNVDYGGASTGNWATVTLDIEFEYVLNVTGLPNGYTTTVASTTIGAMGGASLGSPFSLLLQDINQLK